jgi:hypothetical protein
MRILQQSSQISFGFRDRQLQVLGSPVIGPPDHDRAALERGSERVHCERVVMLSPQELGSCLVREIHLNVIRRCRNYIL